MPYGNASGAQTLSWLTVVRVIARLKLLLTLRYYKRNAGAAVAAIIAWIILLGLAMVGAIALFIWVRDTGPVRRDSTLFLVLWIIAGLWLLSPLSQMDSQNSLDLSGLRLFPLSRGAFTSAALLDALLSPMSLFLLPPLLLVLPVFTLRVSELPWLLLSLVLLAVALFSFTQAFTLWAYRLLQSRRFADASIIISIILFAGLQALNISLQHIGQAHAPPWLTAAMAVVRHYAMPLLNVLLAGAAAKGFAAACLGDFATAGRFYALLALQAVGGMYCAGFAARQFYGGEIESGGVVEQRRVAPAEVGRGGWRWGDPQLQALMGRERTYLFRDPMLKMLFLQSLVSMVLIAVMLTLNLSRSFSDINGTLPGAFETTQKFILFLMAVMLGFMESALLFNKYGYEGQLFTQFLLTPASRLKMLQSKSLFFLLHFCTLNLVVIAAVGYAFHAPPLYLLSAMCLTACNTCLVDLAGHYVSIYFPFTYRRSGRRFRAVMPHPGCGYMLIYGLVFNGCNLIIIPGSAGLILGTVFGGTLGFAIAAACYITAVAVAYRFVLPHAAQLLVKREPELLQMLNQSAA